MRRSVLLPLLLLALVSACSSVLPGGQQTSHTYSSVTELAKALRTQQLDDATASFRGRVVESAGVDVLDFSGGIDVTSDGTDMTVDLKDERNRDYSIVVVGQDIFTRHTTGTWQKSPLRESLGEVVLDPAGLPVIGNLWFTQLDGSADAFSLTGSSTVLGSANTEYRLQADFVEATNLALRHVGVPALDNVDARIDLDLSLTLDPDDRLVAAHWTVLTDRETRTIDCTFTDWGSSADITAPSA